MRRTCCWLALFCVLLAPSVAGAISYTFTGYLTSAGPDGALIPLTDGSGATTFFGSFSYDPTVATSTVPGDPDYDTYHIFPALQSFSVNFGVASIFGDSSFSDAGYLTVNLWNDHGYAFYDTFDISAYDSSTNPTTSYSYNFTLTDTTQNVFGTVSSLPTTLSLANFNQTEFRIHASDEFANYYSVGVITGLSEVPATVPEPSSLLLLGGGLLGLVGLNRRRRK